MVVQNVEQLSKYSLQLLRQSSLSSLLSKFSAILSDSVLGVPVYIFRRDINTRNLSCYPRWHDFDIESYRFWGDEKKDQVVSDFFKSLKTSPGIFELVEDNYLHLPYGIQVRALFKTPKFEYGMIIDPKSKKKEPLQFLDHLCDQLKIQFTWLKKINSSLNMTYLDDLTGLYNQKYLLMALESEINRSNRLAGKFSLLFIDIDNFKLVNDTYGHLTGSSILIQMGKLLKSALREIDIVVRYGGDEFVALLIDSHIEHAAMVANRVREMIGNFEFINESVTDPGLPVKITASFGISMYPADGNSAKELIAIADKRMYKSKKSGKNSVFWSENKNTTTKNGDK